MTFLVLTVVASAIVPKLEFKFSTGPEIFSLLSSPINDSDEDSVPVEFLISAEVSSVGFTGVEVPDGVAGAVISSSTTSSDNISTNSDGMSTLVPLRISTVVFSSDTVSFL